VELEKHACFFKLQKQWQQQQKQQQQQQL